MKKLLLMILGLLLIAAVAAGLAWRSYDRFVSSPLDVPAQGTVFLVEPGSHGMAIVDSLAELGLTRSSWQWRLLMRLEPAVLKAGEYQVNPGATPRSLLRLLASGRVVRYRFTIVEGWTFGELAEQLRADPVLLRELDLENAYGWDPGTQFEGMAHAEGWFLPETYHFVRGDSDLDLLQRAHTAMRTALDEAWSGRDTGLPLKSPYELLILASIIEKETAREDERRRIAGVFVRRLDKGMRLQTDPTVIYGIGDAFDGDIRRRDLRTDTPYNTYTRHGLPPTPIAMPGRASLQAAAHPEEGEELYFVADGSGGHTFSRTLAEHQAAVDRLLGKN
ncbi:MAG: endolytic transglycosylase MltG [Lysobacterales bacterium]